MGYLLRRVSGRFNRVFIYDQIFRKAWITANGLFVIGIAAVFLTLHPYSAFADDQPQLCKEDGGKTWYFAVGRTVFEIKNPDYSKGAPLIGDIDPKYALTPPNPKAPLGCKDNPQQLASYTGLDWPRLEPIGYVGGIPSVVGLINLTRYPYADDVTPNIDPAISFIQWNAEGCMNKNIIIRSPDGTFLCLSKFGALNPLSEHPYQFGVDWEYIISGNTYLTPLGQELVLNSSSARVSTKYLLKSDIILQYTWTFPHTTNPVTPTYLVNIDKVIQKNLLSFEVKNFRWPGS